jgi:hypothetical protein
MRHSHKVNVNGSDCCRLVAKPQAWYALKGSLRNDSQYIELRLVVRFDVIQALA